MRLIIFLLIISLLISCQNEPNEQFSENKNYRTMNGVNNMDSLIDVSLRYGDTNAFMRLRMAYLDFPHGEFLPIAKEMADKYRYKTAYYDTYFQMLRVTQNENKMFSLDSCNSEERKIAINYLKQAADLHQIDALYDLGEMYLEGGFLIEDSIEGSRMLDKYDSIMASLP